MNKMLAFKSNIRVISLLPSATEILCAIGGESMLVGRCHEDNFPLTIIDRPVLTGQATSSTWTSAADIDREVSNFVRSGKSLYTINSSLLKSLSPHIILTQDICSVCAIDLATVNRIASTMDSKPIVVSLNPSSLYDVINDMVFVGKAVGLEKEAELEKQKLEERISKCLSVASKSTSCHPLKVAFIEWSDPIYVGGHWTPELIRMAGGLHTLNPSNHGCAGEYVQKGGAGKSFPVSKEAVIASDPDVIIISPCGLQLKAAKDETALLLAQSWFYNLTAVQSGRLFVVDGDAMFNRPGPRLVDALEWLVSIFHATPEAVAIRPPAFPYEHISLEQASAMAAGMSERLPDILPSTVSKTSVPSTPTPTQPAAQDTESRDTVRHASIPESQSLGVSLQAKATPSLSSDIEDIHLKACNAGQSTYIDPTSGYVVFTALAHKVRQIALPQPTYNVHLLPYN